MTIDTSAGSGVLRSSGFTIYEFDIPKAGLFSYQFTSPGDDGYTIKFALPTSPDVFSEDNAGSASMSDTFSLTAGTFTLWADLGHGSFTLQWWYSGGTDGSGWQNDDPSGQTFFTGGGSNASPFNVGVSGSYGTGQFLDNSGHFDYGIQAAEEQLLGKMTQAEDQAEPTHFHPAGGGCAWFAAAGQSFASAFFGNWDYSAGMATTECVMLLHTPDPSGWQNDYTRVQPGGNAYPSMGPLELVLTFDPGDKASVVAADPKAVVVPDTMEVWILGGLQNRISDDVASAANFADLWSSAAANMRTHGLPSTLYLGGQGSPMFPQRTGNFGGAGVDYGVLNDPSLGSTGGSGTEGVLTNGQLQALLHGGGTLPSTGTGASITPPSPAIPPGSVTPVTGAGSGFDHDFLLTTFALDGAGTSSYDGGGGSIDPATGNSPGVYTDPSTGSLTGDTGGTHSVTAGVSGTVVTYDQNGQIMPDTTTSPSIVQAGVSNTFIMQDTNGSFLTSYTPGDPTQAGAGTPIVNGSTTIPLPSYYIQGVDVGGGMVAAAIGIGVTTTTIRTNSMPVAIGDESRQNFGSLAWEIRQTVFLPPTQSWYPFGGPPVGPTGLPVTPPPGFPGMGIPVLRIWDGKVWHKIGPQSSSADYNTQHLKLNTVVDKSEWVIDLKQWDRRGYLDAHPLKIWDGIQWAWITWMTPWQDPTPYKSQAGNPVTAAWTGGANGTSATFDASTSLVKP